MKKSSLSWIMLLLLPGMLLLSSCNASKNVVYFQDLTPGESEIALASSPAIKIGPEDKISIIVSCRDPQLAMLFNLPTVSMQFNQVSSVSSGSGSSTGNSQGVSGYTVDRNGEIDFPVLGKIKVAGMDREEIAAYIKSELLRQNLVKDPVVTVEYMNLCFSILGEVNTPGRFSIDRDHVTLLDALSMAGDLTINGNRKKVMVMRQENGMQRVYGVDLTSGEYVYTSPAYYLQQNDVVYIEPNDMKARQSTVNGNNVRSTAFWLSLASFLTTIAVLVFK